MTQIPSADRPALDDTDGGFTGLVESNRVHRDIYVSPAVFDVEMDRIFKSTWVYVGHDSEIAQPGDYKTTTIGREPVILSRDRDGARHVLINRCSHRAAAVCQWPAGNATAFRCHYHGWTFGSDGRLIGVSFPDGYASLDKSSMGLASAPRVEDYRGFIFASFNPDVPTIEQHLGAALPYLDRFVDQCPGFDLAVATDAHELHYNGNWKLQMENGVDGYHANFTHQSFFAFLQQRTGKQSRYISNKATEPASSASFDNGHALLDQSVVAAEALRDRLQTLPHAPPAETDLNAYFGTPQGEDLYFAIPGPGFNLAVFPNLQLIGVHIREIHPIAVDRTRVVLRPLLPVGAPDELNRLRLRYHELFFGPAGFGQPDDLEMFERVREGLTDERVEWLQLRRGEKREVSGVSRADGNLTDETPQRGQYRRWRELMGVSR